MPVTPEIKCLRAGVGRAEITCRADGIWADVLSEKVKAHIPPQYLQQRITVDDPLYVRALVLDDGREMVALVTMDVTAIAARTISQNILDSSADDFVPKLRLRLEQELGLPGACVNISASHTHQVARMLCSDDEQIAKTVAAVSQALQNRMPVKIGAGARREDRLTFNRTMMMRDGTDYTFRGCNPAPPDEAVAGLRPIDPEIGILRVDRLDGSPLAVVYNFASHLLLGSPQGAQGHITADHAGVAMRYIEANLDGVAMALFLQGAQGDIDEVSRYDTGLPASSLEFGTRLGQDVVEACRGIATGPATLRRTARQVEFPLRTDLHEVMAQLQQAQAADLASLRYTPLGFKEFLPLYLKYALHPDYPSHWAFRYMQAEQCGNPLMQALDKRNRNAVAKYLASIRAMERMARNEEKIATLRKHHEIIETLGAERVPAEIQGIRIGDSVLITAPMELLAEVGLNVKRMSPFKNTLVVSLSNGYLHYAPPASYYPRGGYEATECLLAPEWEGIFEAAVRGIFNELNRN